jgi:hypothetical protein
LAQFGFEEFQLSLERGGFIGHRMHLKLGDRLTAARALPVVGSAGQSTSFTCPVHSSRLPQRRLFAEKALLNSLPRWWLQL